MNWQPEGFKNPYTMDTFQYSPSAIETIKYKAFNDGGKAMLEALRKDGVFSGGMVIVGIPEYDEELENKDD
jgi:hypothetical protein